jgi:hypothetical protein
LAACCVEAQTNGILRQVFANMGGGSLANLTNNPGFPSSPSSEAIDSSFEAPVNWSDNYSQRMMALLSPPQTGQYTFWISSDDQSALYLSTDDNPSHRLQIAYVGGWTSSREWTKETNQKSGLISLTNGQRYYIEAIQSEGGGGDNLAVRWQLPDGTIEEPIPGSRMAPYGLGPPVIIGQPTNTTATEGTMAAFNVRLGRSLGATYQWIRGGTNIPLATNATYALGPLRLADSNSSFSCFIANAYGSTNSTNALLKVVPDATRPTLVSVVNLGDNQIISVLFSEPLEAASANQLTNYVLNNGASVLAASLNDDLRTVVLNTTPLADRTTYTLAVSNVRDRASTPNPILPGSQKIFTLSYLTLDMSRLVGVAEPLGPSSRCGPLVISEIMYHPTNRPDGRNLEFLEIYNSQDWAEDVSGCRLSGQVSFTFPTNTIMPAKSYLLLAASPADVRAVYGLSTVLGYTGLLNNGSGAIRLKNRQGGVVLDATYSGDPPFPAAADGAGHSLVLARPSLGEGNPLAWAASDRVGGSPGTNETATANPHRTVLINELLAHPEPPDLDYLELFNYSTQNVNLAGCVLTDDPTTNKFRFPTNTVLQGRGYLVLDESRLGFALSSGGETVYLINSNGTRVIDAVRFPGQAKGISYGRYPDGAPGFHELVERTPGTNNARLLVREVVINEIMCDPISGLADDEYVELYNRGTNAVNLSGWRLRGGISFNFPATAALPPGGYLVVAHSAARLISTYPSLNLANTVGDYSGSLGNSGDTVKLLMPDDVVTTNLAGVPLTNKIHAVADEVSYRTGGRWGRYTDGGGSSLELVDPRGDHRLAPSWAPSDETGKSGWVTIEKTGVLDNGADTANSVQIVMLGAGECLVDNVEVIPSGSGNLVSNSTFEAGLDGWVAQGTHDRSGLELAGGYGDNGRCLHVCASGHGDTGANRIRYNLATSLAPGSTATLRMRVRWLKGWPEILIRLRGNYLEATGNTLTTRALGTPGLANSRALANSPPAIVDVQHSPVLPAASQPVLVSARVHDPDGLSGLTLKYRVDPSTNFTALAMGYNGAGYYSATIPAQAAGALVAFSIEAKDNHPVRATATFPDDAPRRECLVRWGEPSPPGNGSFGTYRYWITQATIDHWSTREKLSSDPLDGTFAYNGRVIYNVGGLYSGSPWHAPGWNSPVGNGCDYELVFPPDDQLMGNEQIKLLMPGNGGGEGSAQCETHAYWIASELGIPFNYARHVNLFVNGQQRNQVYVDSQQPNSDFMKEWFPDSDGGDLYKMVFWYEFDDAGLGFSSATGVSLGNFTTTGGVKKLARYRWNWLKRAAADSANNYTNLFALVDAANTGQTGDAYTALIQSVVNVDEWARFFMLEKLVSNGDSYGNGGGQNLYGCKPAGDLWRMLIWDIDFAFGGSPTSDMFGWSDAPLARLFTHPPFQRAYYRAMLDTVNGPIQSSRSNPILDARYAAFAANGINPASPQATKDFLSQRRTNMLASLASVAAPFAVTSNGGNDFGTNRNIITLAGTAPVEVNTITINGAAYPVTWTSLSNWTVRLALAGGTNALLVQGLGSAGALVAGASDTIKVNFTGPVEWPQDKLVINEIMYNPTVPNASYLEIHNTAVSNAFDLTGYRLDGVGFTFSMGTVIQPGSFVVVAKNRQVFAATYGSGIAVAGEFAGSLDNDGETISLVKPGPTPAEDLVIDSVCYHNGPPWPTGANGGGYSLQLIDPLQDHNRVANWYGGPTDTGPWHLIVTNGLVSGSNLVIWLDGSGDAYLDELSVVPQSGALAGLNIVSNGGFEEAFGNGWTFVGTNMAGSSIDTNVFHSGKSSLHVASTGAGGTSKNIQQLLPAAALGVTNTLSYWFRPGTSGTNLTVRSYPGSFLRTMVPLQPSTNLALRCTPGATNLARATLPAFPPLWVNEILPQNLNGLTNSLGEANPWVELFNSGTNTLDLTGFFLSDDFSALSQWAFPTNATIGPGQFLLVWLDGPAAPSTTDELHASFRPQPTSESLVLSRLVNGLPLIMDYLKYSLPIPGWSCGSIPDGNPLGRRSLFYATPGASNNPALAPLAVLVNEWMADNSATVIDPADDQLDDWFELYNPGTNTANLEGCFLTDDPANKYQFRIPAGCIIPPGGYLLVWADNDTGLNQLDRADLHVNFKLSKSGETIGLFASDGSPIDVITFGPQLTDVSQGRFPDGSASICFLTNATPGSPNLIAQTNTPPVLAPLPDRVISGGSLLIFTAAALDTNFPAQTLTFSLEPGAPVDASIDPASGLFTWRPSVVLSPATNLITVRVSDSGTPSLSATSTFQTIVIPLPRMSEASVSGDSLTVCWQSHPGKIYQVQYCEDLGGGGWINLRLPLTATGSTLTITDSIMQCCQRFYRVVQEN